MAFSWYLQRQTFRGILLLSSTAGPRLPNLLRPILTFGYSSWKRANMLLTDDVRCLVWYFVRLPFCFTETTFSAWCLTRYITPVKIFNLFLYIIRSVWTRYGLSIGLSTATFCIADCWKSSLCTASLQLGVFSKACSIARWALVVAFAKAEKLLNGLVSFLSVSCFSSISIVFKKSMFCNSFATFFPFPFH